MFFVSLHISFFGLPTRKGKAQSRNLRKVAHTFRVLLSLLPFNHPVLSFLIIKKDL